MNRKILEYDDNIMLVEVHFEKNETGVRHKHQNIQMTYILKGKFEFEKGSEKIIVTEGETLYFPSNIEHGVLCLEEGSLLDIFNPIREDFL